MAWHALDVIQPAIDNTVAFFSGPGLFKKWVKIGVLAFIFSILSGGGGGGGQGFSSGFNDSSGPGSGTEFGQALADISAGIAAIPQETVNLIIVGIMVGVVVLFVLGIVLTLLKNMCFFAILESISTNKVEIIPYLGKFFGKALSLTILEIVLGLLSLPFVLALLLAGISILFAFLGVNLTILGSLAGIASNAALMASSLGLSIVFLSWGSRTVDNERRLRTQFNIPTYYEIVVGGCCGYPSRTPVRPVRKPIAKTLIWK